MRSPRLSWSTPSNRTFWSTTGSSVGLVGREAALGTLDPRHQAKTVGEMANSHFIVVREDASLADLLGELHAKARPLPWWRPMARPIPREYPGNRHGARNGGSVNSFGRFVLRLNLSENNRH